MEKSCTVAGSFPELLDFSLSISFHRGFLYSYIIWGMDNRLVGDRSSEISSDTIDMNNNRKSFRKRILCLELDASSKEKKKVKA